MIQTRYVKYGVISGLLLLCTIIVSTTEDSQRLAFAQITPAPAKTGESDDELSTNSTPDTGGSPITPSPNSETDGQDTSSSDEQDDSTDAPDLNPSTSEEQVDGTTTNENEDPDPTNQLVEAIMNEVNDALSASGIFGP